MSSGDDDDPSIEITATQMLRCRYVRYGCQWFRQFQPGEDAAAEEARRIHQGRCVHRFHAA